MYTKYSFSSQGKPETPSISLLSSTGSYIYIYIYIYIGEKTIP